MGNSVEGVVLTGKFQHSKVNPLFSKSYMVLMVEVTTTYCRDHYEHDDHSSYDQTGWRLASQPDVWRLQEMGAFDNVRKEES